MKFRIKLLSVIICVLMLIPMFVACGDTPETPTTNESQSESVSETQPDSESQSDSDSESDEATESQKNTETESTEITESTSESDSETDAATESKEESTSDTESTTESTSESTQVTESQDESTSETESDNADVHVHSYTNQYGSNAQRHWLKCDNGCSEKKDQEGHILVNGTCVICGKASAPAAEIAHAFDAITIKNEQVFLANFTSGTVGGVSVSMTGNHFDIGTINEGDTLMIGGWIGYGSTIENFGYVINGDYTNIYTCAAIDAEDAVQALAGTKAKRFNISACTLGFSGAAEITFVALFSKNTTNESSSVKMAEFLTIDVENINGYESSVEIDTTKPKVNVIILSGQSNAYGASPIMDSIIDRFGSKNYSNIFLHYNNINIDPNTHVVDPATGAILEGEWKSLFSNAGFEQYRLHMGGQGTTHFGPELGIAEYLSTNRPDEQFYIIKFTAAGTVLNGQWVPNDGNGFDPCGLLSDMGNLLYIQMRDYIEESLAMLAENYNPVIEAFMWMQGESDSGTPNMASAYAKCERIMVNALRRDFADYASEKGIAYIDGAISSTSLWPFHQIINDGKMSNCGVIYDPTFDGNKIAFNDEPGLDNSFFIYTDSLITKAQAGEDKYGPGDGADTAHYASESMLNLGTWFAYGYDYLMGDIAE